MAGTSYTRQSTLTDGDTITAGLFNNEYNQIVSAFSYTTSGTTGHQHDGSAGQGGNIHTIGDQDFLNKIVVDTANNRVGFFIEVSGTATEQVRVEDGAVVPVTNNDVDLGSSSVQFKDLFLNGTANIDALVLTSGSTVTTILNEDNMSSDSDTALATQQSIKAYVDAQVTAQDLDLTDGTTIIAIDLDSETLSILGGTGITSTASGNGVTLAIDGTVTTLTGTQTLTNKTIDADNNTIQNLEVDNLKSGVLDTDISSVSSSDDTLPSAKAVKTYVDAQVTAQDLDFQGDSGGALNIDLDSETLTVAGGTGIDTSGATNTLTVAIDSTVATLTGTQTLTNKTFTSPDINTPDIDGGTIDNTVIGGSTAAAGSFTTVDATGNITVAGTVDGRDVATDGAKLDGIEAAATADQTAAEIRTLVESATDSNVFTDADHSKLNAIESGATADQTAAEIKTAYESNADTNAFTDADHSKLDGIEASADVTDTTNVTAAGALMDSELTSEASVKAINQGLATSDSPTFTNMTLSGTDSIKVPSGTTAQRNGSPVNGMLRYNSTTAEFEGYKNNAWDSVGGGGDIVEDTTPQLGGDLDLNSSDITGTGNINITGNISLSGTVDGRDVATDGTKLDGIEASADVTDTANVTAAGAVMDSELTSEASVKALNQGVATTDSPTFAGLTVDTDTLYIDSTNNRVGIGTTSPSVPVHVYKSQASPTIVAKFENPADEAIVEIKSKNTDLGVLQFADTEDANVGTVQYSHSDNSMRFKTNDSERLRIDSSGQVGIGTTSPTRTFHSKGASGVGTVGKFESGVTTGTETVYLQLSSTGQSDTDSGYISYKNTRELGLWTADTERMTIDSSGQVGIGTASADEALEVSGDVKSSGGNFGIYHFGETSDVTKIVGRDGGHGSSPNTMDFFTNSAQRMRIDASGDVGIGTTAPASKVEINTGATGQVGLLVKKTNVGTSIMCRNTSGTDSTLLLNPYNGTTTFDAYASSGGQAQAMLFRQGGSGERMRLESNGRLGIGTSAPVQELHVVGDIVATGNITAYYSDERLKNLMGTIPSALDKVSKLNGYYYTPNTTALSLGVESKGVEVGVSAQEIEEVLPEIIADSVVGKGYKTVMYEKITPLLIEAIKELSDKVSSLEAKVKEMEK